MATLAKVRSGWFHVVLPMTFVPFAVETIFLRPSLHLTFLERSEWVGIASICQTVPGNVCSSSLHFIKSVVGDDV